MDIDSSNNCHHINNFFKINLDQEVDPDQVLVQVILVHMAPVNRSIKVDLDLVDHKWVLVQAVQVDQWDLGQDSK